MVRETEGDSCMLSHARAECRVGLGTSAGVRKTQLEGGAPGDNFEAVRSEPASAHDPNAIVPVRSMSRKMGTTAHEQFQRQPFMTVCSLTFRPPEMAALRLNVAGSSLSVRPPPVCEPSDKHRGADRTGQFRHQGGARWMSFHVPSVNTSIFVTGCSSHIVKRNLPT